MHSVILVFALFIALSLAHECQHGKRTWPIQFLESTNTRASSFTMLRSTQTTYDNIRIYPDYSNLVNATAAQKDWVMNQLMPNAISYFQSTLKVIRLTSNVKAEFTCYGLTAPTDLQNTGVVADIIILVGTENDGPNGARAISGTCGLSKINNRPSFGALIFNLDLMDLTSVPLQEQFLVTAMHEMTHILGFSKPVYPFFIDPVTGNRLTNHIRYKIVNGQNITLMDTPPLTSRLRTYFNCSNIEGAYLEQEGGVGNAGAHFETRIFSNDMMVGASRIDQVISMFDLAMLEGTGWYQPNYTNSEAFTWGQGDGCGFYDGPCVSAGGVPLYDEYCAPLTQKGCTNNARGKAFCGAFPGYVLTDSTLPTYLDYWSNKTVVGYKFADNCPVYGYYANSDCEDPVSKAGGITGEVFTPSARCFPGTLVKSTVIPAQRGYCFNVTCQKLSTGAFNLTLTLSTGAKVNCAKAGPITVSGYNGTLTCPEPNYFCTNNDPNYCERGCLGRGVCTEGKCVCPDGWKGSDCGARTYVSGCARCASDPLNKVCYGNMCVSTTS